MPKVENLRTRIESAVAGDTAAVERLLFEHYSALERHIGPRIPASVRRQLSVEDVLQDVFTQVFRDIGDFDPRGDAFFLAWLRAIADHRLADALKRIRRKKRGGDRLQITTDNAAATSSVAPLIEIVCQDSLTASRVFAQHEIAQAVRIAVAGLPDHQRDVIWARFIEHKSVDEIAQQTGRSSGAIRGLIERAKSKLREAMGRSSRWFGSR